MHQQEPWQNQPPHGGAWQASKSTSESFFHTETPRWIGKTTTGEATHHPEQHGWTGKIPSDTVGSQLGTHHRQVGSGNMEQSDTAVSVPAKDWFTSILIG